MSDGGLSELIILAEYLNTSGVGKTTGRTKTIFVNHMPADATKSVLIRQDYLGIHYVHELPGYFKTTFQVICRDRDMESGDELAKRAIQALTVEEMNVGGGMYVKYLRPRHKPIVYPASQGDQFEFLVNMDACYLLV